MDDIPTFCVVVGANGSGDFAHNHQKSISANCRITRYWSPSRSPGFQFGSGNGITLDEYSLLIEREQAEAYQQQLEQPVATAHTLNHTIQQRLVLWNFARLLSTNMAFATKSLFIAAVSPYHYHSQQRSETRPPWEIHFRINY
ncbi:hypothetical protein D5085_09050 [Ectothiorhodospiraceae bacterium BW-2]|nr:hypothetical protein D5085_09050 [Ectothiorhodospiraceae bacterium BW-2]